MELLLIDMVKRHEAIYNTKCNDYSSGAARQEAWISISEQCGSTVQECKDTWFKLRNCYTNVKKRRLRKSGHKFDTWRYEEEMSFLDPYFKRRSPVKGKAAFVEDTWQKRSCSKVPRKRKKITTSLEKQHLLIDLIRRYELIYNSKCKEYRDVKERQAAWVEIADLHGSTVKQCKEAWLKLRNCYTNALKRKQINSARNMPSTPWQFGKAMSFLKPYLRYKAESKSEALLYEDSWEASSSSRSVQSPEPEDVSTGTPCKRTTNDEEGGRLSIESFEEVDLEENTPEPTLENQDLDDLDHFFLSMSRMTKKLPKLDQLRIKLDLHKAINEAELKQLENDDGSGTGNDGQLTIEVKQEVFSPECSPHTQSAHKYFS